MDGKPQLTVDAVEELIRRKIFERVIPGSSILNTGFRLFGRPEHGITPEVFHRTLAHLGVILSPEDSRVIFDKYDHEGNGRLQFDKFAVNLFPKDYTQPTWNIIRDQEQWLESQQRQHALNETHKVGRGEAALAYPKSMEKFKMSQEEIKLLLQRKIEQRARRPEVQLQVAFKMFGSPKNGLTPDSFRTVLWKLGIPVSREDCLEMFRSYDADGGGVVDL